MRTSFAALLFVASALASPEPQQTASGSLTDPDADASAAAYASSLVAAIPSSVLTVIETAIPASWQDEVITDPSFRSSVASAAAAGTYPAWYNELPNSVKAWASSNFDAQILGIATTTQDVASETASTATSGAPSVTNAAQNTSSGSSSAASSGSSSAASSGSGSGSTSASASASPAKSTGGAPAPTSGVALGIAGAAGALALALAL
ncbi:uncharacterized protein N7458_009519 [Penicillium daleae]|uniref:Uncharacterized protein n=1 Tax=Penicillium daleae TaxID=63821 RepID=A0AAD6FZ71_9EURO|nr:uncharacterized protein N7458_009519 [Penicillium daleae]KAJ5438521.1 hypothetical protein N7458_009519 [Penicillium daleae]